MADANSDDSFEFSFGYFEAANEDIQVREIGSDISVSPVSSPELSTVDSSSESKIDDEDLACLPSFIFNIYATFHKAGRWYIYP